MRRTKLPKNLSNNNHVIKRLDDDFLLGDLYSTVRYEMIELFRAYMRSAEWALLRINVIARDKKECQGCGKSYKPKAGFVCHHTSYRNWGKANYEEMMDVELLCRRCHNSTDHSFAPFFVKRNADYIYISKRRLSRAYESVNGLYDTYHKPNP